MRHCPYVNWLKVRGTHVDPRQPTLREQVITPFGKTSFSSLALVRLRTLFAHFLTPSWTIMQQPAPGPSSPINSQLLQHLNPDQSKPRPDDCKLPLNQRRISQNLKLLSPRCLLWTIYSRFQFRCCCKIHSCQTQTWVLLQSCRRLCNRT